MSIETNVNSLNLTKKDETSPCKKCEYANNCLYPCSTFREWYKDNRKDWSNG